VRFRPFGRKLLLSACHSGQIKLSSLLSVRHIALPRHKWLMNRRVQNCTGILKQVKTFRDGLLICVQTGFRDQTKLNKRTNPQGEDNVSHRFGSTIHPL